VPALHRLPTACGVRCRAPRGPLIVRKAPRVRGSRHSSRKVERCSPSAGGASCVVRRRTRGNYVPRFCAWLLRPAWTRVRDRRCPSRSERGKAPPARNRVRGRRRRGFDLGGPWTVTPRPACTARCVAARIRAAQGGNSRRCVRGIRSNPWSCSRTVVIAEVDRSTRLLVLEGESPHPTG
jgi:hypothetical protein